MSLSLSHNLRLRARAVNRSQCRVSASLSQHRSARVVLVASKNPVKVNAVRRALQSCFPALEIVVIGREASSGVPEQPFGDEETLAGARNRVASLLRDGPRSSRLLSSHTAPSHSTTSNPLSQPKAARSNNGAKEFNATSRSATNLETHQPSSSPAPSPAPSPGSPAPSANAAAAAPASGPVVAANCDLLVAIEGGVGPAEAPGQAGRLECFAWVCATDPQTGAESTTRSGSFALPQPLTDLVLGRGIELGKAVTAVFSSSKLVGKKGVGTIGMLSNGVLDRTEYYVQATVCAMLPYMQPKLYGSEYERFLGSQQCGGSRSAGNGAHEGVSEGATLLGSVQSVGNTFGNGNGCA
ncbi:hypothetical protein Agub_g7760 [Astrephomene gubernaculifera]|uniref:inosine/xanthosine triphosphatase n=1 Tax=Astrephomene gubernaculifera TaxID=47775 RepID=A0AAD3DSJ0_9CHLO|nr:hypothetical protein Agub_g7760 [Astrephomene gubernaculifera]